MRCTWRSGSGENQKETIMLRSKWEFEYTAKNLAIAAEAQKQFRASRAKVWEQKKEEVIAKIKDSGLNVHESIAASLNLANNNVNALKYSTQHMAGPQITIRIVTATREPRDCFATNTALGRSLALSRGVDFDTRVFASNSAGLSTVYNVALREAATDPAILIFIHDAVEIIDYFWIEHIAAGLRSFDLIGLAGNIRRLPRQPGWAFTDDQFVRDMPYLSGTIGHEDEHGRYPNVFGPSQREVKLLDGVMLACHSETLRNIRFDEAFDFHFYDLD